MKIYPDWSWNRLPTQYSNSPFFTIDKDVCFGGCTELTAGPDLNQDSLPSQADPLASGVIVTVFELPKRVCPKRRKASA